MAPGTVATITADDGRVAVTATVFINAAVANDLVVTPGVSVVRAGGLPIDLIAKGGGIPVWSLSGPGSLSATSGRQIRFLPPVVDALTSAAEAIVTATSGDVSTSALIRVEPAQAQLSVEVVGPAGARVALTRPNGFTDFLDAPYAELASLSAGSYLLTPAPAREAGEVVDSLWTALPVTVVLAAGERARTQVVYSRRPGTGALWGACFSKGTLVAFSDAQFSASPTEPTLGFGLQSQPVAMAFEPNGDLWTLDYDGTLRRYAAVQLASSGTPRAEVTITVQGTALPRGIAFDRDMTLWVSNLSGHLLGVPRSSQAMSGTVSARSLRTPGASRDFHGLAVDAQGRLWASDYATPALIAFSESALRAGGSQAPEIELKGSATRLDTPLGLHFDRQGSLWVADYGSPGGAYRFERSNLATSGAPAPTAVVNVGRPVMDIATDRNGDLWVVDHDYRLARFASSAVVTSGTPLALWSRQLDTQTFDILFNLAAE